MEKFSWGGSIIGVRKSYTATFVPLLEMTPEMWRWLDFENLREAAINSIAEAAEEGIVGFFNVRVVEKAGPAKDQYFSPATGDDLETFLADGTVPFENTPDVPALTSSGNKLWQNLLLLAGVIGLAGVIVVISTLVDKPGDDEYDMTDEEREQLEQIQEQIESGEWEGIEDIDAALAILLTLQNMYPSELLEELIEEIESQLSELES